MLLAREPQAVFSGCRELDPSLLVASFANSLSFAAYPSPLEPVSQSNARLMPSPYTLVPGQVEELLCRVRGEAVVLELSPGSVFV